MKLRPATLGDARLLFDWRNDPETCAASLSPGPVSWDGHIGWLERVIGDPNRMLLIFEEDGPVGTVRLDGGELSWTVSPDHRGRGIGKAMVLEAMSLGPTFARIKRDNLASQRVAYHAGFRLAEDGPLQLWTLPVAIAA